MKLNRMVVCEHHKMYYLFSHDRMAACEHHKMYYLFSHDMMNIYMVLMCYLLLFCVYRNTYHFDHYNFRAYMRRKNSKYHSMLCNKYIHDRVQNIYYIHNSMYIDHLQIALNGLVLLLVLISDLYD